MIYIAYNKRSYSTAINIAEGFNQQGIKARTVNRKRPKHRPSVFIRWGNSYAQTPAGAIEINSAEAVSNASNKLLMARTLTAAEGVSFPEVFFPGECGNVDGYYRNRVNTVVRRDRWIEGDLYMTTPIARAHEYRVHVFNGKTMGVYEKMPHDPEQFYCKDHNSDFRRIDVSNEENRESIKGVRPMAAAAVKAMGLVFGGVDVITSVDGNIYVNEVNSAPALNTLNIPRFIEKFNEYLHHG